MSSEIRTFSGIAQVNRERFKALENYKQYGVNKRAKQVSTFVNTGGPVRAVAESTASTAMYI